MDTELREADGGSTLRVRAGEHLVVRLPETPTTGYRWVADHDGSRLALVDDRFEGPTSPRGAGGERVLVLQARGSGPVTLRLVKRRAWGGGEPAEVFTVEVDVRA